MSDQSRSDTKPDLREAKRFLNLVDENLDAWTFQTFDDKAARHDGSLAQILHTQDERVARRLVDLNQRGAGVFAMINRGDGKGRKKENVKQVRAVFVDLDGTPLSVLDGPSLEPHIVVESSPGRFHAYWLIERLLLEQFEAVQVALAQQFGSDPAVKDLPRVMRLPGFYHQKGPPFRTRIVRAEPLQPYPAGAFLEAFGIDPAHQEKPSAVTGNGKKAREGSRNTYLTSLAGSMRRRGMSQAAIEAGLQEENRQECEPPLDSEEVARIAQSIARYSSADVPPAIEAPAWPDPPAPEAYHGLAGDIVRTLEPHTEADPVAILVQLLIAFGSITGRGPHYAVEADAHGGNLYVILVGDSSKARKGTAWRHVRHLSDMIPDPWARECVSTGLSSGEGLIWAVRDPITRMEDDNEVVVDPGVTDKRLLIVEEELASTLRAMGRKGNTLSPVARQAWDTGDLRTLTKNSPARATGAHISIIGHVTADELRHYLDRIETGNGFANRFLFVFVRRSKCLPFGGSPSEESLNVLAQRLAEAVGHARTAGRVSMGEAARTLWTQVYPKLSEGLPGMAGAVTSRAEAQVVRLALLYALLDQAQEIGAEHLKAALVVWEYAEASARYVFGSALGDPLADEILRTLRAARKEMTRTDISNLFGRHKSSATISRALDLLEGRGLIVFERRDSGGRPFEVWRAT